jgi:hypothetical protein
MNAIQEMPLYLAQMAPRARVPATTYVPPPLQVRWQQTQPVNHTEAYAAVTDHSWGSTCSLSDAVSPSCIGFVSASLQECCTVHIVSPYSCTEICAYLHHIHQQW